MAPPVLGPEIWIFVGQPLQGDEQGSRPIEVKHLGVAVSQDGIRVGVDAAAGQRLIEMRHPCVQPAEGGGHPFALAEQSQNSLLRSIRLEAVREPFGAEIFRDHAMNVRETMFDLGLEEADSESIRGCRGKRKLRSVTHIQISLRCLQIRTGENADQAAQQLGRAYRTGRQQQLFFASLNMAIMVVARILLREHDTTGAVEELCAGLRERAVVPRHLAKHSQRQRILIQGLDPAVRQMRQQSGGVDRRKLLAKEGERVIVRERPQMKQHWRTAIVVPDLHPVCGAQPVGGAAGKDERRIADRR